MKISLDFDKTYTMDPELWNQFVWNAKARGHEVCIVTYRRPEQSEGGIYDVAKMLDIPLIFTSFDQKRRYYNADIWIDDLPELIP